MNKLTQFISIISHPILLPTWMFLILIISGICNNDIINVGLCFLIVFVTTFVIPLTFLLILKKIKVFESLTMEKQSERFIPLIIMGIFLFTTQHLLYGINSLIFFNLFLCSNVILCSITIWINLYWKISLHTIGWGSFSAIFLIMATISPKLYLTYFIACIIISGIVGSARLYLKSHNESQIYTGFAVGFIIPLLIYNLL